MSRKKISILPKLFIGITVPLVSLCATFILLSVFISHKEVVAPVVVPEVARVIQTVPPPVVMPMPTQLKIGSINLAATVNPVGLTVEGNMDIDQSIEDVAWYRLGPKPGEEGSAVIAGHYGWRNGVAAVFNELHTLQKGDEVSTLGEDGRMITFTVTRIETYTPDQDATDVFRSDDGKAHLNLITCQGSWNNSQRTYTERLVVFTDLKK